MQFIKSIIENQRQPGFFNKYEAHKTSSLPQKKKNY